MQKYRHPEDGLLRCRAPAPEHPLDDIQQNGYPHPQRRDGPKISAGRRAPPTTHRQRNLRRRRQGGPKGDDPAARQSQHRHEEQWLPGDKRIMNVKI